MSYRALLFCTDEKTAPVVARILSELEFAVESCREPFAAVKLLTADHFDALVVDCDDEQNAALLFKSARNSELNHSSLAVALVEGQAGIARAFRRGANLVLAKPINVEQSKGTLRVARGLLRKAEAAKPAAAEASPEPLLPPTAIHQDSLFAPAAVEATSNLTLAPVPAKTIETFAPVAHAPLQLGVEAEPVPPLGAEEAALLESMPAPVAPQSAVSSEAAKRYAWQPSAKPLPEAAPAPAPAPPLSVTALAKAGGISPAIDRPPASESSREAATGKASGSETRGLSLGKSAATAAAPAKEIPTPVLDLYETKPLPPTTRAAAAPASKKARDSKSHAASGKSSARSSATPVPGSSAFSADEEDAGPAPSGEESNTKNLIIAAVLVLGLAASGYYAWPRLQPALLTLPIVQKYLGSPQSEVSAPVSPAVPAPAPAAAPLAAGSEPPPSASDSGATEAQATPVETGRAEGPVEPNPAASAAAGAAPGQRIAAAHPSAAPGRAPKPILVKDDLKKNSALKPGAAQPAAPAPLEIASSSGDKAIAGIVTVAGTGPSPVLKTVHVSQGVSNGLLIKRVAPLYPTLALQMRVAGTVELEATISKDGSTANVQALKGDSLLRQAAVNAVRQWKYKPYLLDGQQVEIVTQITVNFVLPQ
jgi:TonB family protein